MIDLHKQKHIGIKQARKTIANIYRKKKDGGKLTREDQANIAKQEAIIARWERAGKRGWKL